MKNKLFLSIVGGLAVVLSLGALSIHNSNASFAEGKSEISAVAPLVYHYDSIKVTSTYQFDHAASAATQAYVRIVYPIFDNNNLNDIIKSAVLSPLKIKYEFEHALNAEHPALSNLDAINNAATDYQQLGENFLRQFETQAPTEDLKAYWYADVNLKVVVNQSDYMSILCTKDYFTGGFHDLYDHLYLNYDIRSRQVFTLESQLKPHQLDQLKSIAERIFRKNEGLTPTQVLDGYFFENDKFSLPADFTFTSKGLLFFYDYYEIKPFAAGTTELVIPFNELRNYVLPNSILAGQMSKH